LRQILKTIARPRIPDIVYRPDLVGKARKGALALVSLVAWSIWLYLLLPAAALLAWWFGYQRLDIFVLQDPAGTIQTLIVYAFNIGLAGIAFILWAVYNWIKFGGEDRRGATMLVDNTAIGQAFQIDLDAVCRAQTEKILDFSFNEQGQITLITAKTLASVNPPQVLQVPVTP
jgi:poly-beta-1,6-N-acetyl-D-glucosamine biosynthesis protein PgaD